MATLSNRIALDWELNYPLVLGGAGVVCALIWAPDAFAVAASKGWKTDQLYSAVFQVGGIFTAFLFTFYSFVVMTESGFIGRVKQSRYYKDAIRYTMRALALGALLTFASIPMMVADPKPASADPIGMLGFALWFGLTLYTFAAFYRAAYIFSIFSAQQR